VLGSVLVVPLAALLVMDWRRRAPGDRARRRLALAAIACVALIALSYIPLVVEELQSNFTEARAAAAFLTGGGPAATQPLPIRLVIVALRVLAWPLTGLVTAAPLAALIAAATVVAILAWRARSARAAERFAARFFAATLAWSIAALTVAASTLATVVPGLPNDHYHAFLDPLVFVTVGMGAAALWRRARLPARALAAAGVAALVAFNVLTWPPRIAPDGGWPAAEAAAARVAARVGSSQYVLVGVPAFKSADAMRFPLVRTGAAPATLSDLMGYAGGVVVACDRLFEEAAGYRCGGPGEDAAAASVSGRSALVDRFDESPRTSISIYLPR
jgi:hypothetical protein